MRFNLISTENRKLQAIEKITIGALFLFVLLFAKFAPYIIGAFALIQFFRKKIVEGVVLIAVAIGVYYFLNYAFGILLVIGLLLVAYGIFLLATAPKNS